MKMKITQPLSFHELGKRANQEDSIFPPDGEATPADRLFMVCDGMGGHDKGEVASATVCEAVADALKASGDDFSDIDLENALSAAYDALDARDTDAVKKMGTTLTFVRLHSDGATLAHIGDSRIYYIRPSESYIWHTRDHSLVQDLFDIGEITAEEMRYHPQRNVITHAMQPHQERRSKAAITHIADLHPGDWLMLCSDGVLENLTDEQLLALFSDDSLSDEQKREKLIAMTADNSDNHSAWFFRIESVSAEDNDADHDEEITSSPAIKAQCKDDENIPLSPQLRRAKLMKNMFAALAVIAAVAALAVYLYIME